MTQPECHAFRCQTSRTHPIGMRCLASSTSFTVRPSPGSGDRWNRPSTGFGGFSNTACWRGDGSFHSQGLVVWSWLAARWRLAIWPIVGWVWCGTSSTPWACASAMQRERPVMPPILTTSGCTMRTPVGKPGQRIGLLAGGDGDVEPAGDLAHRLRVIMLHRLLEPPEAEFLERAADPDRAAERIAVIGIEGE